MKEIKMSDGTEARIAEMVEAEVARRMNGWALFPSIIDNCLTVTLMRGNGLPELNGTVALPAGSGQA